jgi:hypothetical protein
MPAPYVHPGPASRTGYALRDSRILGVVLAGLLGLAMSVSLLGTPAQRHQPAPTPQVAAVLSAVQAAAQHGTDTVVTDSTAAARSVLSVASSAAVPDRVSSTLPVGYSWCSWAVTSAIYALGAATIGWLLWVSPGGVVIAGRWIAGWILRTVKQMLGSFSAVYSLISAVVC